MAFRPAGQDYRLLPLSSSVLLGAALTVRAGIRPGAWTSIAILGALCVALLALRRLPESRGPAAALARMGAIALLGGTVGSNIGIQHADAARPAQIRTAAAQRRHVELSGTIAANPSRLGSTCTVEARPARIVAARSGLPTGGRVRIIVRNAPCEALAGQKIWARGNLGPVDDSRQPVAMLNAKRVRLDGPGDARARIVASIRGALASRLADMPAHARELVPAVVLGDAEAASAPRQAAMRITQLAHLVAVSGGHVSILIAFVVAIVGRRLGVVTALAGGCAVCGLVALVGPEASVVRAVAMSAVVLAALAMRRSTQAIAALSVATIAAVAIDPWLATSFGFYLSASATTGIIVLGGPLAEHLSQRMPRLLAEALAIPLAAQIFCLPILACFAESGSIWGVLANALVAPVVAPLTVFGLLAALLAPIAPVPCDLALIPAGMCTWWIDRVAGVLAGWPGSGITIAATLAACLAILAAMLTFRKRAVALPILGALAAYAWWAGREGETEIPDGWEIVQCDVGQGAGLLARTHGLTIMVDTGPPGSPIRKCLEAAGAERIDVLVLTHGHSDHIGGVGEVLDAADVDQVWVSPNMDPPRNGAWLDERLASRGIELTTVSAGHEATGRDGATAVRVLWPRADAPRGEEEANAQSIALRVDVPGGLLVMGDQTEESQARFAADVEPVRTMLVSHHGSADQSARLARNAAPRIALISVGDNSYGHPTARAMELYAAADVYDTRTCGTIVVRGTEVTSGCHAPTG